MRTVSVSFYFDIFLTRTLQCSFTPLTVAVTVAVPTFLATILPFVTLTIAGFEEDHFTFSVTSSTHNSSESYCSNVTDVLFKPTTVTLIQTCLPLLLETVMVATPGRFALIFPFEDTVAIDFASLV